MHILIIGYGDLGSRLARLLLAEGHSVHGLKRRALSTAPLPIHICDVTEYQQLKSIIGRTKYDYIFFMPTPDTRTPDAYRHIYHHGMTALINACRPTPPQLIIMASSISVYHHNNSEWVDEESEAHTTSFNGQAVRMGEKILQASGLNHCIVRIAGIYGPQRHRLIARVRNGYYTANADQRYTNRIHIDDCAALMAHLINLSTNGTALEKIYLACDDAPVTLGEVEKWLAAHMNVHLTARQERHSATAGSKKCRNQRIKKTGYRFIYPDYRAGYSALLERE